MAEDFMSITELRKELPQLSQTVQAKATRYVITNLGKPQSVLLGYSDYKGLLATVELLSNPEAHASLERGLQETELLTSADLRERLERRQEAQSSELPARTRKELERLLVSALGVDSPVEDKLGVARDVVRVITGLLTGVPTGVQKVGTQTKEESREEGEVSDDSLAKSEALFRTEREMINEVLEAHAHTLQAKGKRALGPIKKENVSSEMRHEGKSAPTRGEEMVRNTGQ